MSQELTVAQSFEIVITPEQKELVKKTVFPDATDAELQLFFFDCTRRGIHPLDKLIHPTKRNGKYTPITSIDLFRQRASESGEHMGTEDAVYVGEPGKPNFAASVTVYKHLRGEKCAFTATARWSEYYPGEKQGFMWQKMPHLMLAKCAEALALRKAFPQQLHGLYTHEEMAQAEAPIVNIPQTRPRNDATMVQPPTDRYTGEPIRQEDGAENSLSTPRSAATPQSRAGEQISSTQPSSDAPAPKSAADFAMQQAAKVGAHERTVVGFIGSFAPYQGSKAFAKGVKPGFFDVETDRGEIALSQVRYFDPKFNTELNQPGPLTITYTSELYNGKTQYKLLNVEADKAED